MRSEEKPKKLNNAGFSLVELIIALMLAAVVSLMLVGFIETSRTVYQKVDEDAQLQTESQAATSFMREIASCAEDAGCVFDKSGNEWISKYDFDSGVSLLTPGYREVIWFKGFDYENESNPIKQYYVFALDQSGAIRFAAYPERDSAASENTLDAATLAERINADLLDDGTNSKYALLAEHVERMKLTSETDETRGTLLTIEFEFLYREHSYSTQVKVLARNM